MHTNIGERLAEARKRKGISLKEASESLKIRADFLRNFENNRFDFDLPHVYMSGFLKLYAEYLKLDARAIMTDFKAVQEGHNRLLNKKEAPRTETLGRMAAQPKPQEPTEGSSTEEEYEEEYSETPYNKESFWKIGVLFGGAVTVLGILALIGAMFFRSSPEIRETQIAVDEATNASSVEDITQFSIQEDTITLNAEKEIQVIVRQEADKQRLYSGVLKPGQPKTLARKGAIKIHFSDGSSLMIQKANGDKVRPGRSGVGWIEIG